MPHRDIQDGDMIFIRARAVKTCSDAIKVEIIDYPQMILWAWAPASECALPQDIGRLLPRREAKKGPLTPQ